MANRCSVEIFLADGVTASLRLLEPQVEALRFASQIHGGYRDCSFRVPGIPIAVDYPELPYRGVVKVYSRQNKICWQGRIEDRYGVRENGLEYVEVVAVGDYNRMNDRVYNKLWVEPRQSRWWFPDSANGDATWNASHRPDLYKKYTSKMGLKANDPIVDVLGLMAQDGKKWNGKLYAMWRFECSAGDTIKRITFTADTLFPTNTGSWRFGVFNEAKNSAEGTPITTTVTAQAVDLDLSANPTAGVWLFLQGGVDASGALATLPDLSNGLYYGDDPGPNYYYGYSGAHWDLIPGYGSTDPGGYRFNLYQNEYMTLRFTGKGVRIFGVYTKTAGLADVIITRVAGGATVYTAQINGNSGDNLGTPPVEFNEVSGANAIHLDWDTYDLKITVGAASGGAIGFYLDHIIVDTSVFAEAYNVVLYGATGAIYADTILKDALTTVCPDISSDQSHITSPGVLITDAVYQSELRPTQIAEKLALLGDGSYNIWDVAVWEDSICYFAVRPTAYTHRVQLEHCSGLRIGGSMKGVWNKVGTTFQDAHGTIARTAAAGGVDPSQDLPSQALYGIREFNIPAGNSVPPVGQQATSLAAWKAPTGASRIVIDGGLQDANGVDTPLEEFRAGNIILVSGLIPHQGVVGVVDNRTVFFAKIAEYDADRDRLTISPGDPADSVETELLRIGGG